jgi:serine/threonine protein kinase
MPQDTNDNELSLVSLFDAATERSAPAGGVTQGTQTKALARSRSDQTLDAARQLLAQRTVIKQRFQLEKLLGFGGMGIVFKARDLRKVEAQDRAPWVAIKLLNEEFRKHPDALISLQREARKSQALVHPNIIRVFDFDRDDDVVFMTMEFLQGQDLNQYIQRHPQGVGIEQTRQIAREIGSALQYAHDNQIVHTDLTPKNVFLTDEGRIRVLDFGIAQAIALADTLPANGDDTAFDPASLGGVTPAYAGMERLQGMTPEPADDVYALGCIVYLLLTGTHPYKGRTALEAESLKIRPARIKNISSRQWRALQKALALSRAQRYQRAQDFIAEFAPPLRVITRLAVFGASLVVLVIGVLGYQSLVSMDAQRENAAQLAEHQRELATRQAQQSLAAEQSAVKQAQTLLEYLALAETLLAQERFDEAQLYLQRVRTNAPQHQDLLPLEQKLLDARAAYQKQQSDLAADNLKLDQLLAEADQFVRAGEFRRAETQLAEMQKIAPGHRNMSRLEAQLKQARAELKLADAESARQQLLAEQRARQQAQASLQHAQQLLQHAQQLLQQAQQLLDKRPATPENFASARQLMLQSQRESPDFGAVASQLQQLPQRYIEAVQRLLGEENYPAAEGFLQAALAMAPQSTELLALRAELAALQAEGEEEAVVPTSF